MAEKKKGTIIPLSIAQQKKSNARNLVRKGELSQTEISETTGISRSIVLELAREEGIKLPRHIRRPHPAYAEAVRDLQDGMKYHDVAKKHNLSLSGSYKWAVKIGAHNKKVNRVKQA